MEDSTETDHRETMPDNCDPAGEEDGDTTGELKALKLHRGRKAAMFTRACNTAEAQISRRASEEGLKKRLETLNTTLDAFMEANDEYVEKLQDTRELEEAEEYATRMTARHAETVTRIEDAITHPSASRSASRTGMPPLPSAPLEEGSKASGSHISRGSKTSVVSKEAEITAELKALELKHLKARKEREREMRKQEDMLEERALEEEVERAVLKARLWKAAGNELEWDRRHDFEDEVAVEVVARRQDNTGCSREKRDEQDQERVVSGLGELRREPPPPKTTSTSPMTNETQRTADYDPSNWVTALASERRRDFQGPSAFVKSIPRLTLPTFRGSSQEWPRWIGLFKALVHDQPSLSDSERMAHLQNAVEGPAAQAIEGMLFNGSFYQEALKTLQERFGREEDIIQSHLRKIFISNPPALTDLPAMEKFYAIVHNTVTVLQNLGYSSDLSSSENLRRVVEKLPNELAREWGREVFRLRPERPTLKTFSEWLQVQVNILSFSAVQSGTSERKRVAGTQREGAVRRTALATGATNEAGDMEPRSPPPCLVCSEKHRVIDCPSFKGKTVEARMEVVYEGGLCFSCLRKGHWTRSCRSSRKCGVKGCKLTHHPLLHRSSGQAKPDQGNSREEDSSSGSSTAAAPQHQSKGTGSSPFVAASLSEETDTLLQVVQVRVHGATKSKDVLALLDTGAQTSLCSDDVLQELGIAGDPRQLCIQNVEGSGAMKPSERVTLTVSALGDDVKGGYIEIPEVWAVPSLNVTAPTVTQRQLKQCEHLRGLKFPQYDGGDVKLLLGGNVLEAVLQREVRVGRSNQPAAVRTEFGWALAGSISAVVPSSLRQVMFLQRNAQCRDDDLTATVKDWWSTEAFGTKYDKPVTQSREDERALSILKSKTRRLPDRYETGMLWKEDQVVFPDNKRMAVKRLEATERKLKRNPDLAGAYQETLQTYIQEGHARKLTPEEASQHRGRRWFLPHHAVTNPNKPGKVRVVFDAAAKFQGTSLNDKLLTGPDLLKSLPGVLLRFREEPIALTADIEKMYHQVRVTEEDQPSLSFLWRDLDTSRPPDVYQMQVVVFGAKSSPAMANYVLQKTAQAHQERATPESEAQAAAVGAVFTNFYMDDFLKSERTPQAAMKMQRELSKLLASGGFRLTKWLSNSREVLESIPSSERARGSTDLGLQHLPAEKTLGVIWDSEKDTLSFQVTNTEAQATKREVLRQTASVFDPLGIGAPFIIRAKILLQHLWTLNLDWDQALPDHEDGRWRQWLAELQRLKEVAVPRCLKPVVGSCRELKAELRAMEREIAENLSAFEVDWHFNPPAASHMGGVWERLIRSVKKTLKVVVGPQTLTDEVLVTVLTEVEHMINSRPLTHVSSEPTDPEALTPNHFLLGGASRHLAPGLVKDRDMCSRRRWKHAQAVAEHVWKRWTREYVPTLIQRSKWRKEQRNLQVGDLVLMAESNMSRGSWPLARIRRVFPSADGRVRSAELQTASGKLYTRPATKICFLEEECK